MNGPLEWFGAIGAIVAAAMIAADLGRKVTGWGFVLFCVVSAVWIVSGLTAKDGQPIAVQNGILLLINGYGVWQFLLSRKKKREIEKADAIAKKAEHEVAAEDGVPFSKPPLQAALAPAEQAALSSPAR